MRAARRDAPRVLDLFGAAGEIKVCTRLRIRISISLASVIFHLNRIFAIIPLSSWFSR